MLIYFAMCFCMNAVSYYLIKRYMLALVVAFLSCHVMLHIAAFYVHDKTGALILWSPYSILFSILFATPIALVTGIPFIVYRRRKAERIKWLARECYCTNCEYDLPGNVSGICSECGTPIPKEVREKLATKPQRGNGDNVCSRG